MKALLKIVTFLLITAYLASCHRTGGTSKQEKLFESIPAAESGIDFVNQLTETVDHNYYKYMYTYIGGGVASGDFNNDGLVDLFFVSNIGDNKLYLNGGNLKFKDISREAGIDQKTGF